ncbi:hypothetical protein M3J09_009707 [Ascochyta lentis]
MASRVIAHFFACFNTRLWETWLNIRHPKPPSICLLSKFTLVL